MKNFLREYEINYMYSTIIMCNKAIFYIRLLRRDNSETVALTIGWSYLVLLHVKNTVLSVKCSDDSSISKRLLLHERD